VTWYFNSGNWFQKSFPCVLISLYRCSTSDVILRVPNLLLEKSSSLFSESSSSVRWRKNNQSKRQSGSKMYFDELRIVKQYLIVCLVIVIDSADWYLWGYRPSFPCGCRFLTRRNERRMVEQFLGGEGHRRTSSNKTATHKPLNCSFC